MNLDTSLMKKHQVIKTSATLLLGLAVGAGVALIGRSQSSDLITLSRNDSIYADPYLLARNQSFSFFDDISEDRWLLHQQIYRDYYKHAVPDEPLKYNPAVETNKASWFNSAHAWYQNNYEPNHSCEFERRIGGKNNNGDGGKWICDPHRIKSLAASRKLSDPNHPGCVIYSIGSNGDFSFEMGMQDFMGAGVCEFHIFDIKNYENQVPKEMKRTYFHKWGLKKQDSNATEPESGLGLYGLIDTIKLLGHEKLDVIDIFKIDCENCEWEIFNDWLRVSTPMLHQIQVEVHQAPGETALNFFDSLDDAGYLIFHKEPNIQFNPDCIEYAFVKVEKSFMEE